MTQPPRTTETISRDHDGIREVMHRIRELTVPDRATVAVGLVGHLATMMNRNQMSKLLDELREQAERVQDVPPARRHDFEAATGERDDVRQDERDRGSAADDAHQGVGQAGRGEFRSGELL